MENQPRLGKIYEITYLDHYVSHDKGSQEAVFSEPIKLRTFGVYIGKNKYYHIFSWNYSSENSDDNDNFHLLKKDILNIRELK